MRLAGIHRYPVKSTMGHDPRSAEVLPWGLAGDRRYLVTDAAGRMLTARTHARLLTCRAEVDGEAITLTAPGLRELRVTPSGATSVVRVWNDQVELTDCGAAAAAWFGELLGLPARLAWLDDPARRPVDPEYGGPLDRVNLADAYPVLLATTASMAQLNAWIAETACELGEEPPLPLPIGRFRPNLVIEGVARPFAEDSWSRVRVGEVEFRVVKGCARCVIPTIDPVTLRRAAEPTRTLARHRRWSGQVWFGMNLIPTTIGQIHTGDAVIPI